MTAILQTTGPTEPGSDEPGASSADTYTAFHSRWEESTYLVSLAQGYPASQSTLGKLAWAREGDLLVLGYMQKDGAHPSSTTGSLLFFFLSVPCEVKSLPGIPPSPAPAIATFSQAPSQPQASQTLTPLAVQAAPQVRTSGGSWMEAVGRSKHGAA